MLATERQDSPSTIDRILDGALACIGRSGLHGASMRDIAAEAGVSKALVHYHFHTKELLFLEVQARAFRQVARSVRQLASTGSQSLETAFEALDRVWDLLCTARDQVPFTLELYAESTRKPAVRERVETFAAEMLALLQQGLEITLGAQASRLPVPVPRLAAVLHNVLWGHGMMAYFDVEGADASYRDLRLLLEHAASAPEATP